MNIPTLIILTGEEAATNADILQGTRLQTAPSNGFLSFEFQASDNDGTDNYTATIQMPDGQVPITAQRVVMGGTAGLGGQLDVRFSQKIRMPIEKGGHCVFSCIETGDAEFFWRVTFNGAS